jgi:hypothetical protein
MLADTMQDLRAQAQAVATPIARVEPAPAAAVAR